MGDNQGEGVHTLVTDQARGVYTGDNQGREAQLCDNPRKWGHMGDNHGGGAHMRKKNQEGVPTGVRTREERRLHAGRIERHPFRN